jgi:hypothetical protein
VAVNDRSLAGDYCLGGMPVNCHETNSSPDGL